MSISRHSSGVMNCTAIAAALCTPLVLLAIIFWDRGTTHELKQPLTGTAMAIGALLSGGASLWHWFRPREDLPRIPAWNLRRDSPGRWVLAGVGRAILLAGLSCLAMYQLLNVLAQHLPGAVTTSASRLERFERGGSRGSCVMYAEFSLDASGRLRSCVEPTWGISLLRGHLRVGTIVQVEIEENALGRVLVSIK